MALGLVIRTAGDETWEALILDAPDGWIFHREGGGLLLSRGPQSSTGVQLLPSEPGTLALELPLFMSPTDYVALTAFVPKVCERVGAREVEIGTEIVPLNRFERVIDEQVAPQLVEHALEKLPEVEHDPHAVIAIEGRVRPYLLGHRILAKIKKSGREDRYSTIVELVAALQEVVLDDITFVGAAIGAIEHGEKVVVATWEPTVQTLIMPCDVLSIGVAGEEGIWVEAEHIEEVLGRYGVRIDELSWLLFAIEDDAERALMFARARKHQRMSRATN